LTYACLALPTTANIFAPLAIGDADISVTFPLIELIPIELGKYITAVYFSDFYTKNRMFVSEYASASNLEGLSKYLYRKNLLRCPSRA
jgi:hypothetical protein